MTWTQKAFYKRSFARWHLYLRITNHSFLFHYQPDTLSATENQEGVQWRMKHSELLLW